MKFANARNGDVKDAPENKRKESFNQATVSNFRKKMMEEEKASEMDNFKQPPKKQVPIDVLAGDQPQDIRRSSVA